MRLISLAFLAACTGAPDAGPNAATDGLTFEDAGGSMTTRFTPAAVEVRGANDAWTLDLRVTGFGRENDLKQLGSLTPSVRSVGKVSYPHVGFDAWYENRPDGLKQGFDVAERPVGDGPMMVQMELDTAMLPVLRGDGQVRFYDDSGRPQLAYDELVVFDAQGAEVRSWMELDCGTSCVLSLVVDDTDAVYPIVIDPRLWTFEQKIRHATLGADDAGGTSVAIVGDAAFVGAALDDHSGFTDVGSVRAFTRSGSTWTETQLIVAGAAFTGNNRGFGSAVAFDGTTLVVGAPAIVNSIRGRAYVFNLSGGSWVETTQLTGADGANGDRFGAAVDVDGSRLIVGAAVNGASAHTHGALGSSGGAYVFRLSAGTWVQEQEIVPTGGAGAALAAGDRLGASVAIDGGRIAIGAPQEDGPPTVTDSGSVYLFSLSGTTWVDQVRLRAADATANDRFGASVDLDGTTLVTGAVFADPGAVNNAGAAYVFEEVAGLWSEEQKLTHTAPTADDQFGRAVALEGDTIVVGSDQFDAQTPIELIDRGNVWVYLETAGTWNLEDELIGTDSTAGDRFGRSVAYSIDTAIVGAPGDDTPSDAGSSYVFLAVETDADGDSFEGPLGAACQALEDLGCDQTCQALNEPLCDCDDTDAAINPDAAEVEDNDVDENCDNYDAFCSTIFAGGCEGRVAITEVLFNPAHGVDENFGEWIEIVNTSTHRLDLRGSVLLAEFGPSSTSYTIDQFIVLEPGEAALIGGHSNSLLNGGIAVNDSWEGTGFSMFNSAGANIIIQRPTLADIDTVEYTLDFTTGTALPDGASISLDPSFYPLSNTRNLNDNGFRWCDGRIDYGTGQFGTPGVVNQSCEYSFPFRFTYTAPITFGPSSVRTVSFWFDDVLNERFFTTSNSGVGAFTRTTSQALGGQQVQFQYEYTDLSLGPIYTGVQTFNNDCVPSGVISGTVSPGGTVTGTFDVTNCP